MTYKEDEEKARERTAAWWEREILDRVCIGITAPKENFSIHSLDDPVRKWTDIDYILSKTEEQFRSTFYGGEKFPVFNPTIGTSMFANFLGANITKFTLDTVWTEPLIKDWETAEPLVFNRENKWWCFIKNIIKEGVKRNYYVAFPDTHANADALSDLRGTENLCLDIIEKPEKVKEAMDFLRNFVIKTYEELFPLIQQSSPTYSFLRWGIWSKGRANIIVCDFSALISPQAFRKFLLPDIESQIHWLDHSIYHLDSPDAIRHLDLLLDLPELDGIQWQPGEGNYPMSKWIPLLKRIQKAKKNIVIGAEANEIEFLLSELSPKGLMILTEVDTEGEAKELLKKAIKWTKT